MTALIKRRRISAQDVPVYYTWKRAFARDRAPIVGALVRRLFAVDGP